MGLFACGQYGASGPLSADNSAPLTGLFYGGVSLLGAQVLGNGIITLATFSAALALMLLVKAVGLLRVSKAGELEGLDLHEHGIPAYLEFQLISSAKPHGGTPHGPQGVIALSPGGSKPIPAPASASAMASAEPS